MINTNICTTDDLMLTGNSLSNQSNETDGKITSTQDILAGAIVVYDSKIDIMLLPGFRANETSDFHAFLDGCDQSQSFVQEEQSSASTETKNGLNEKDQVDKIIESSFAVRPNPFEDQLQVDIGVKESDRCSVTVFNNLGRVMLHTCLLYTSPSPRDATISRMPSSA